MKKSSIIALLAVLSLSTSILGAASLEEKLIEAAKGNKYKDVKRLLEQGADVNARDKEGTTALLRATIKGHTEIVKLLLKNRNLDARQKLTAMIWAERQGHTEIARLLRQAGMSIDDASLNGQLLYAATEGNFKQVQLLLNKGAQGVRMGLIGR